MNLQWSTRSNSRRMLKVVVVRCQPLTRTLYDTHSLPTGGQEMKQNALLSVFVVSPQLALVVQLNLILEYNMEKRRKDEKVQPPPIYNKYKYIYIFVSSMEHPLLLLLQRGVYAVLVKVNDRYLLPWVYIQFQLYVYMCI